jgi:hypothetical protein
LEIRLSYSGEEEEEEEEELRDCANELLWLKLSSMSRIWDDRSPIFKDRFPEFRASLDIILLRNFCTGM